MNRVLILLGAAGLIALLAWVTLSEDSPEGPERTERPRPSDGRRVVDPGVVETPPLEGRPAGERVVLKPGPLTGIVLDPNGDVHVGARVEIGFPDGTAQVGETDDHGRFRFLVLPGQVAIRITTPLYPPYAAKVAAPADLGEIRLERGYEITGRVVDEAGYGVAGVTVTAQGLVENWRAPTDEEGRFRLRGIPKVAVRLAAYGIEAKLAGEGPEVTPPASDIVLTVKRYRMGYGVVVTEEGGAPVPGATVRLTISRGGWSQVEADEKGRFAFDLTDARYSDPRLRFTVLVTAAGYEDVTVADLTLDQVRPAANLTVKLVRAVSVEPGRLRGRVLYDTGDPFHGSLTLSFSREGKAGEIFRIATNEKGEFLVPKVAPGEYVLRSAPHGESLLRETGKTLVIPPGGEETTEFTLTRGGDLKLTVTGPDGKPVKEAAVAILDEDGAEQRSFIIPDGTGVIPDLVPGPVRVRVSKAGYETAESEVTVVKDQVTDATVRLSEDR